jgi:hypothetical protein
VEPPRALRKFAIMGKTIMRANPIKERRKSNAEIRIRIGFFKNLQLVAWL